MKTKSLCQLGVIFTITLFFLTSCNKIAPDVVSPGINEFQLQEPDETAMWLSNSGIGTG